MHQHQLQSQTIVEPPARVFVGNHEARLLGTRAYLIEGVQSPAFAALVELPWVLCHCGGDEAGHPLVAEVAIEPCGTDSNGVALYWDTGVIIAESEPGPGSWDAVVEFMP